MRILASVSWDNLDSTSVPWGYHTGVKEGGIWENSPLFTDHKKLAIMEFIGPHYLNFSGVNPLSDYHLNRRSIKNILLVNSFHSWKNHKVNITKSSFLGHNRLLSLWNRFDYMGAPNEGSSLKTCGINDSHRLNNIQNSGIYHSKRYKRQEHKSPLTSANNKYLDNNFQKSIAHFSTLSKFKIPGFLFT